ncbi:hypothetical protein QUT21_22555, partial [Xanthomonas citri pv. citri]
MRVVHDIMLIDWLRNSVLTILSDLNQRSSPLEEEGTRGQMLCKLASCGRAIGVIDYQERTLIIRLRAQGGVCGLWQLTLELSNFT